MEFVTVIDFTITIFSIQVNSNLTGYTMPDGTRVE